MTEAPTPPATPAIDIAGETAMSGADLAVVGAVTLLALAFLFRRRLFRRNRATPLAPACSGCAGCGGSCPSAATYDFRAPDPAAPEPPREGDR
ncbi:hypothetical protein [Phaeovulum vinaykumarii]|uniref:Virus attachment protein p12 family protein n=1 Tax=Phaeovulum vinaykumarii TaxID=407234 RepID=A0A1N7MP27_9RHOB|nr:hypothetical protein [Phaeovulum vinaykumarii]SIS87748.1 hypothetical protein SAMN05421795_108142 [Phaeovulum vinaykumarii]SOC12963.1 hypothetical protein SAMN05878426_1084 [Phaeovulum vinaykumarii]